jgi:hypothetical protein
VPNKKPAQEFFRRDGLGHRQDEDLHNEILDEGDHDVAKEVSRRVRDRILGITPDPFAPDQLQPDQNAEQESPFEPSAKPEPPEQS